MTKFHDSTKNVRIGKKAALMLNLAAFVTDCVLLLPFRSGSEIRPMLNPVMWLFWELIGVCFAISVLIPPRQRHAWWIAGFNLCPLITGLLTFWGIMWLKGFILEA